ncbi:MAG: SusC/RagA family TonB-linked outer membrane protein [Chitinophagales bacterium]
MDDVEDIQVLKGPTATAIYGIRAANGVVLVTTKKGPKSKEGGPIGVSLNTSLTFEQPLVIPDFQNSYGQGPNKDFFTWGDEGDADGAVDESWGPPLDKGLEFVQWNSYTVGGKPLPWVSRPNNVRSLYRTGITWNNSVAFEGATDKFTYRLSFGNNNQKGMIYNTDFNRYTVAVNASGKLTEKLTSSFSLNYIKEKSGNLPTGGYASENFVQQTIWSGRNVDFNALKDWRNLPIVGAGRPAAGTPYNWNTQFQNNPFWVLDNNLNKYDKNRIIGNIQLNYQIKKYLFVKARTGADYWSSVITEQKSIGTNESLDGFFRENHRNATEMNSELMIGYDDKFLKDRLGVTLTLAGNLMTERYKRVAVQADALELPGLYTIGNVKSGTTAQSLTEQINSNLYSIYGTGGLSWDGWIYTDFSVRNDWSSRLPKKSNNFLSYSVGGGLVLSELIKKNQDMLNYLKIRGSYSKVGSFGALEPYRTDQTFTIRNLKLGSTILIFDPSTLNNPNLKPESTKSWEVGLEARLIKNRINFDVAYYEKKSSDLLVPVNVSAGTGYTSAWNNVASIKNNGVELQFGAKLLDKADYKIGVNLNWAKNWNKVLSLGGLDSYILGGQWDMTLEARVGQPLGLIVGHDYLRAPDGQIIHTDGLPTPDPTTKVFGSIVPKWTGGVSLDIYVKGVSISTLFDMKWGGLIHSMTYTWGRYAGTLNETLLGRETGIVGVGVKNVGTVDNPTFVPNDVVRTAQDYNHAAFDNSTTVNGTFDASYVKWRQLVVSYSLPKKAFKNTRIEDVGFGVVARNLMILYKKAPHIDPESAFSSANGEQGQEFGQLPSARSIGFNFNIKF